MTVNISVPQLIWGLIYVGLTLAIGQILHPFAHGLAWALLLAVLTWPLFLRVRQAMQKQGPTAAAIVMTVLLILIVTVPLALLARMVAVESGPAIAALKSWHASIPAMPGWVAGYPLLAGLWQQGVDLLQSGSLLGPEMAKQLVEPGTKVLGVLGVDILQGAVTLFVLFFLYRNGDAYLAQTKAVMHHLLGEQVERLVHPMRDALRAVFAGIMLTAACLGLAAAVGFTIVGLPAPLLLGAITAVLAMIPFVGALVWVVAAGALLAMGAWGKALFIGIWGGIWVSIIDHVLRPWVISGRAKLPYLQSFLAVVGGLEAFGLMGLFIGPAILALALVIWRDMAGPVAEEPTNTHGH